MTLALAPEADPSGNSWQAQGPWAVLSLRGYQSCPTDMMTYFLHMFFLSGSVVKATLKQIYSWLPPVDLY